MLLSKQTSVKKQTRLQLIVMLLFCQFFSAAIPAGMMLGPLSSDGLSIVFCGSQNNSDLLNIISPEWKKAFSVGSLDDSLFDSSLEKSDLDHYEHETDGICPFSGLSSAAVATGHDLYVDYDEHSFQLISRHADVAILSPKRFLLGPINKAPPA